MLTSVPHPSSLLLVALGGDGTILRCVHERPGVPVLGFNLGGLGYLSSVEKKDFDRALALLAGGRYRIAERTMLAVRSSARSLVCSSALNDIVITREMTGHAAMIDLSVDGHRATRYLADGLVIAKLDALERLLEDLHASGHRALVFSQFVDYLAIVRKMLEKRGWTYRYLDGATSKGEREKSVAAFQSGEGDFFLISLKAGGMGLNLTSANYVILLDPWWNPAVENQAADRVHRIGQRLPVTVYRLIAQDTVEEKVVKLHAKKTALAEDVLSAGASALSAQAMLDLLSEK